jgi:hypothetical protein
MVGLSKSAEQFQAYFIVGEPTEQAMLPAYTRAIGFLKDATGAQVVLEKDVDILADQIEDKVHHGREVAEVLTWKINCSPQFSSAAKAERLRLSAVKT